MEDFNLVDLVVAVIIVGSALFAYSRGFVREVLAIGGWMAAAVLGFIFAAQVRPLVKEIPLVGSMVGSDCEPATVTAFAIVMAISLVVLSFFTPMFGSMVQRSALGGLDQGFGFLFGVVRGLILVGVMFFVYDIAAGSQRVAKIDESRSAKVAASMSDDIAAQDPYQAIDWVKSQYTNLVSSCEGS